MFYSHQLLARKAPLGQIWMAATMHAKINRRKLDKLNLIQICEEILNPSVPMALRLSGILMGGVVIVYERKVKLLYEDVTRLLVEINEAWKVKPIHHDPTILPRGKSQAKYRAVTLPDINEQMEAGLIEQSLHFSNASSPSFNFHQSAYFTMRLDAVEEPLINDENPREYDASHRQGCHQAESANITLIDPFDTHQPDSSLFDRFERFDIEGDEDPQINFTPHEHSHISASIRPSPPPLAYKETHQQADEILDLHQEPQNNQYSDERRSETHQFEQTPVPAKRRAKTRTGNPVMDYDQTIIPGHIYQSWLQNTSDIISRRERKNKPMKAFSIMRKTHLMELPPVALSELSGSASREIHYPGPLLDLWMRCTTRQPTQDSPSRGTSFQHPPEPSWSSIPMDFQEQLDLPVQDSHSGVGSHPKQVSIEKQRGNLENIDLPSENEANMMTTPGSLVGDNERSIPSSGSGNGFMPLEPEVQLPSGRPNMKRRHSSSIHSGSSLPPVIEENPWDTLEPDFKLRRLSENGPTDEPEILIETEPTQTPYPVVVHPIDKMTEAIRKQLKMHFDTPGAPQVESVNQLACGMNRKKAAQLFYQTCVLASHDFLKVEQKVPYGDILISKGSKM